MSNSTFHEYVEAFEVIRKQAENENPELQKQLNRILDVLKGNPNILGQLMNLQKFRFCGTVTLDEASFPLSKNFFCTDNKNISMSESFILDILSQAGNEFHFVGDTLIKLESIEPMVRMEINKELDNPKLFSVDECLASIRSFIRYQYDGRRGHLLTNGMDNIFPVEDSFVKVSWSGSPSKKWVIWNDKQMSGLNDGRFLFIPMKK